MKAKILLFIAAAFTTLMVGCGNETPEDTKPNDEPVAQGLTLSVDCPSVEVNTPITFKVVKDGVDVTTQSTFFDKSHDYVEVPNPFTPTLDGEYLFYAVVGEDSLLTNTVNVTVVPTPPALPEDSNAASTSFNHRILLVDHTGTNCGYCPQMMKALKEVSETGDYHSKYYEAIAHSYNTNDPAYSSTAASISSALGVSSYPTLTYNFAHTTQSGYVASHIMGQIDILWKESAEAGIAASASFAASSVVVNAEVKAAVSNEYRVNAWLLEDGIEATQINATEDWMNIHNNAIRQTAYSKHLTGYDLGTIEAGKTASLAMNLPITTSKWNRDNMKVMVIASAKNANGKFDVVNVAICPIGGSVSYDYK